MISQREPLGEKLFINVTKNHTFGTDAVLLATFSVQQKVKTACDLGTGCGIIPMLWMMNNSVESVVGIEIQKEGVELFNKTIIENNMEDKVCCIQGDIKDLKGKIEYGKYDLVTCNPPYNAKGSGIINPSDSAKIARHETLCTIDDIAAAAKKILKFSGRFCLCQRPERLVDVFEAMRKNNIEPKRIRLCIQRIGEEPWLVLIEGRLGGKPGIRIMSPLYIEENGLLSDEMMQIYKEYKQKEDRRI